MIAHSGAGPPASVRLMSDEILVDEHIMLPGTSVAGNN
jgi:hypothetical protein